MSDANPNNKKFYLAIAFSILSLFLLLIVPCIVAMAIARCREKRQERRDALARELEEGQGDDTVLPIPEDHVPVYHHADGHVEVRKPEPTKGKGIASPQARPVGRFQEDLPEASEQLQDKQDAVEESQTPNEAAVAEQKQLEKKN
ncbi:hypothetical protein V8C35DRAFT_280438 [Trichoderma chlorosporum]